MILHQILEQINFIFIVHFPVLIHTLIFLKFKLVTLYKPTVTKLLIFKKSIQPILITIQTSITNLLYIIEDLITYKTQTLLVVQYLNMVYKQILIVTYLQLMIKKVWFNLIFQSSRQLQLIKSMYKLNQDLRLCPTILVIIFLVVNNLWEWITLEFINHKKHKNL